jgi:hypothetical protein
LHWNDNTYMQLTINKTTSKEYKYLANHIGSSLGTCMHTIEEEEEEAAGGEHKLRHRRGRHKIDRSSELDLDERSLFACQCPRTAT